MQTNIPNDIAAIFRDMELIALPKGEDDVRPIGLQMILKKIACSIALKKTREFNPRHFDNLQYCLKKIGTETVSLFFRAAQELHPESPLMEIVVWGSVRRCSIYVALCNGYQSTSSENS